MQMAKGVCVVKRVGSVSKLFNLSAAKRTFAVWICASPIIVSVCSGGGKATHLESASMGKCLSVERRRWTQTMYLLRSATASTKVG
jgi:hypothetical protein